MMRVNESILVCCAGLGMGNASRVTAVVESLLEMARRDGRRVDIHIFSWGAGYDFLRRYNEENGRPFQLFRGHAYGGILRWPAQFIRNARLVRVLVRRLRPSLILLDSDYHFPAYFRCHCPVVYLGQAVDVVERARAGRYRTASWRECFNYYLKECLDSWLQGLFSTMVLVPSFSGERAGDRKVRRIPLIVRKEFLSEPQRGFSGASVGLLLSGSETEKQVFVEFARRHGFTVVAPGFNGSAPSVPSHASSIDQFDVVFTQGGLSSISECIARSKFVVVFPIREHPEQILNACEVESLGLGVRSSVDELDHFPRLLRKIEETRRRQNSRKDIRCNGAQVAASLIYQKLSKFYGQPAAGQ